MGCVLVDIGVSCCRHRRLVYIAEEQRLDLLEDHGTLIFLRDVLELTCESFMNDWQRSILRGDWIFSPVSDSVT